VPELSKNSNLYVEPLLQPKKANAEINSSLFRVRVNPSPVDAGVQDNPESVSALNLPFVSSIPSSKREVLLVLVDSMLSTLSMSKTALLHFELACALIENAIKIDSIVRVKKVNLFIAILK
jgi:hypothetical protein